MKIIEEVDSMGGMTHAVESGWAKMKIEGCAARARSAHRTPQGLIVVVTSTIGQSQTTEIRDRQHGRPLTRIALLKRFRAGRDNENQPHWPT